MSHELKTLDNGTPNGHLMRDSQTYEPRFDIWEGGDEVVLYGDMPGVVSENLDIQYENGQLSIRGDVAPRYHAEMTAQEYGVGNYYRSFAVGKAIDADGISAELVNGVLTLRLPKSDRAKPRKIEVKSG